MLSFAKLKPTPESRIPVGDNPYVIDNPYLPLSIVHCPVAKPASEHALQLPSCRCRYFTQCAMAIVPKYCAQLELDISLISPSVLATHDLLTSKRLAGKTQEYKDGVQGTMIGEA